MLLVVFVFYKFNTVLYAGNTSDIELGYRYPYWWFPVYRKGIKLMYLSSVRKEEIEYYHTHLFLSKHTFAEDMKNH